MSNDSCSSCGAAIEAGAECLACALENALLAPGSVGLESGSKGGFNDFAAPDLPAKFGEYIIRREVAGGGMGVVYEAEQTRLKRTVALKMIRSIFLSRAEDVTRFRTEAEAVARLDHANIVPIYEVGEAGGQPYFTMKLMEGGNLAARLKSGPLPARATAVIIAKIARAVQHAHERGVLHRDIKPGNILFDTAGEPFLTDFGLAKLTNVDSSVTLSQSMLGTPQYMSPEQAAGRVRELTTASDVWALGVVLYQCLTGRLPFAGANSPEIIRRVIDEEPDAMRDESSTRSRAFDRDLETICLRCLEKNVARRVSSAAELAGELERWQRGEPIHSRRVTAGERAWKYARRHPGFVAGSALLLFTLLAGGITSTVLWRRAETARHAVVEKAATERRTSYAATLANALSAREHGDLGFARRLLEGVEPARRGFDWRLLRGLCAGDEERSFSFGKEAAPECFAWLPGGTNLAVITADGRLHLRSASGDEVAPPRPLPPPPAGLDMTGARPAHHGLSFSPDARRFVVAWGNLLRVFDWRTFGVLHSETIFMPDAAWLDDERVLLGGHAGLNQSRGTQGAWMVRVRDRSRTPLPPGLSGPLAVSGDRRFAALSRVGGKPAVEVYATEELLTAAPAASFTLGYSGSAVPSRVQLSGHGTALLVASGEWLRPSLTLEVFERNSGRRLFLQDFKFPISGFTVHPEQSLVAVSGEDAMLRIYDYQRDERRRAAGRDKQRGTYDDGGFSTIRQPLDGNGASAAPRELLTRSAFDGAVRFLMGHEDRTTAVTFTPDGQALFSAGADGTLRRWPVGTARPGARVGPVYSLYFGLQTAASPDGHMVLYNHGDRFARVHDLVTDRSAKLPAGHGPLAVLNDGRFVTQQGGDGRVHCWKFDGTNTVALWTADGPHSTDYSWTRRGVLLRDGRTVVGATAGFLFVVDLETHSVRTGGPFAYQTGLHGVTAHDVSADGKWIAASGFGQRATIHSVAEPGRIAVTLGDTYGSRDFDTAVAFHPVLPLVFVGNEDGHVRVWERHGDIWRPRPDLGWLAHRGAVTALALASDGTLIATSGDDTMKLLPALPEPGVPGRRERVAFPLYHPANWIQFARDASGRDTALLHCSPWRSVELWPAR